MICAPRSNGKKSSIAAISPSETAEGKSIEYAADPSLQPTYHPIAAASPEVKSVSKNARNVGKNRV